MSRVRRKVVVAVAVGGAALAVGGAASPAGAATRPGPLVVAVESPQSGDQASTGIDQLRGVELAVAQVNAHGGVLGRRVRIYRADDRADAGRARAVAKRVIARGIHFVIGPYNSSVGLIGLPIYRGHHVLPVWNTSRDDTRGTGATVQPMNSQIAPVEARYVEGIGARRVAMLVDDTPNGAFTAGMANRLSARLRRAGITVTRVSIVEKNAAPAGYYAQKVNEALAANPDLVYVSTYFPEGAQIATALAAVGRAPRCLMGLANVDNGFLAGTSRAAARRCVFSGVVAAGQMPSARGYVAQYRRAFHARPGVWGSFYYDSARLLFRAIERAGSLHYQAVNRQLRATRGLRGATGPITIDPRTGYRTNTPVHILTVNARGRFVIDRRAP